MDLSYSCIGMNPRQSRHCRTPVAALRWNARSTEAGSARGENGCGTGGAVIGFGGAGANGGNVSPTVGSTGKVVGVGAGTGGAARGDVAGPRVRGASSAVGGTGDTVGGAGRGVEGEARIGDAGASDEGAGPGSGLGGGMTRFGSGESGNIACPGRSQRNEVTVTMTNVQGGTYRPRQKKVSRSAAAIRTPERHHFLATSGRSLWPLCLTTAGRDRWRRRLAATGAGS